VIMVGEMRDALTADIAVKAAQTGHLVLSSLHCRSARAAWARLLNLGVAAANLTHSLSLIVAQRLLRRLCPLCKRPCDIASACLYDFGWQGDLPAQLNCYAAEGCAACHGSGYCGRLGLFELLALDERHGPLAVDLDRYPPDSEGAGLRRAGLLKAMRGETTLAEVMAETPECR